MSTQRRLFLTALRFCARLPPAEFKGTDVVHPGAAARYVPVAGALIGALYLGKLPFPKPVLQGLLKNLVMVAAINLIYGANSSAIDASRRRPVGEGSRVRSRSISHAALAASRRPPAMRPGNSAKPCLML